MKHPCPICGDPNAYPLWVDPVPPAGCPEDRAWHKGGPISIKNVGECRYQRGKAWQEAEFRKLSPASFDSLGNRLPGRFPEILRAFAAAHPEKAIIL